jgi:hypothetical protein
MSKLCCNNNDVELFVAEFFNLRIAFQVNVVLTLCTVKIEALCFNKLLDFGNVTLDSDVISLFFEKYCYGTADSTCSYYKNFHVLILRIF